MEREGVGLVSKVYRSKSGYSHWAKEIIYHLALSQRSWYRKRVKKEKEKSESYPHEYSLIYNLSSTKQSELCFDELKSLSGVDILVGKMNVEVRSIMVNKGEVVKRIKENEGYDFILCAGDDRTDEDMFRVLEDEAGAYCVSVGPVTKETKAKYSVESSEDILNVLGQLVSLTTNSAL